MSTDLRTQLAEYGRFHHSEQRPIDVAEVPRGRPAVRPVAVETAHRPPMRSRRRGMWTAVAAAMVTGALVGGTAWLARGGPDSEVVDQPTPPATVAESTPPATLGEATPATTGPPTTVAAEPGRTLELPAPQKLVVAWSEAQLTEGESRPWDGRGDGILATVVGDGLIDVHDPPWDTDRCCTLTDVIETTRGVVAFQVDFNEPRFSLAWTYLGQGQWSLPVEVPFSSDHALVGDTILMFDHSDATCCGNPIRGPSLWPLLASNDGINWTVIDTRTGQDTHSLELEAGDSFWVYGDQVGGGGSGIEITSTHTVLWISADGLNWEPIDVGFVLPSGTTIEPASTETRFVSVGGDSIYIVGPDTVEGDGTYWVGTVQTQ